MKYMPFYAEHDSCARPFQPTNIFAGDLKDVEPERTHKK